MTNRKRYDAYSDACGITEQHMARERAQSLADARMLPVTGSSVDMLSTDLAEDVAAETCKAPLTKQQAVSSNTMRKKMDYVLDRFNRPDLLEEDPYAEEDAMIAKVEARLEDERNRVAQPEDDGDEEIIDRVPFAPVPEPKIYYMTRRKAA